MCLCVRMYVSVCVRVCEQKHVFILLHNKQLLRSVTGYYELIASTVWLWMSLPIISSDSNTEKPCF